MTMAYQISSLIKRITRQALSTQQADPWPVIKRHTVTRVELQDLLALAIAYCHQQ